MKLSDFNSITGIFFIVLILALVLTNVFSLGYEKTPKETLDAVQDVEYSVDLSQLAEILEQEKTDFRFIDVREKEDYEQGHIKGAVNIPLAEILDEKHEKIFESPEKIKVLYCSGEQNAFEAWMLLFQAGYRNVRFLHGGYLLARKTVIDQKKPGYWNFKAEKMQYDYSRIMNVAKEPEEPERKRLPVEPVRTRKEIIIQGGC